MVSLLQPIKISCMFILGLNVSRVVFYALAEVATKTSHLKIHYESKSQLIQAGVNAVQVFSMIV